MKVSKYLKRFWFYRFLSSVYHSTTFYERKATAKKLAKEAKRQKENGRLISSVFRGDIVVRYGPFQGMKYVDSARCSTLLPKILGSYEEPIHSWLFKINKRYKKILDVGCAEGYFAVGFAYKGYAEVIYAYDKDPLAVVKARELAGKNKLLSELVFGSYCGHDELTKHGGRDTLIFCDIEGEELSLLDPRQCPVLKETDVIFEAHDCFVKNLTERIIERFLETHSIDAVYDYKRDVHNYPLLGQYCNEAEKVIDERRPKGMRWVRMVAIK